MVYIVKTYVNNHLATMEISNGAEHYNRVYNKMLEKNKGNKDFRGMGVKFEKYNKDMIKNTLKGCLINLYYKIKYNTDLLTWDLGLDM